MSRLLFSILALMLALPAPVAPATPQRTLTAFASEQELAALFKGWAEEYRRRMEQARRQRSADGEGMAAKQAASKITFRDATATLTNCTLIESAITNRYYCGCCGSEQWCTSPVTVSNTIIAGPPTGATCVDPIIDGGHNLQFPGTSCGETIQSLDPKLDPAGLNDNGGPTQTIALLPNSPAIDADDPEVCANPPVNGLDQRGYSRPGPGSTTCSIGAYEYGTPRPQPQTPRRPQPRHPDADAATR